jgi:DNA-binding protein HU-beta
MNKVDLIERISSGVDISRADAERALESTLLLIVGALGSNEEVRIGGFGLFTQSPQSAWMGRNPSTGAPLQISTSISIGFRAGEALKRQVNLS